MALHPVERRDLIRSWLLLSVAFGIVLSHGNLAPLTILINAAIALVTVGIGFVAHELAHKRVAERYGSAATYRADNTMLGLALIMSIFGFLFAAPGAVRIHGHQSVKRRGIIALAGPFANVVVALLFIILYGLLPAPLDAAAGFGSIINLMLALFNLLPFGPFDGAKVMAWSKGAFGTFTAACILIVFVQFSLGLW